MTNVKHVEVGQQIKQIFENSLGKYFLVTSTPCTYDYHIQILNVETKKYEHLQINLTKNDNIQLRVQKEDDSFYCFLCPSELKTTKEIVDYLIAQYLHNKRFVTERIEKVADFHNSLLDLLE